MSYGWVGVAHRCPSFLPRGGCPASLGALERGSDLRFGEITDVGGVHVRLDRDGAVDDYQAVVDRVTDVTLLVVGRRHDDRAVPGRQVSQRDPLELVELAIRFGLRQGQRVDRADSLLHVMLNLSQPIEDLAGVGVVDARHCVYVPSSVRPPGDVSCLVKMVAFQVWLSQAADAAGCRVVRTATAWR